MYLQNLGSDHVDLILEFSLWVIMTSPEDGLTIFTEDMVIFLHLIGSLLLILTSDWSGHGGVSAQD